MSDVKNTNITTTEGEINKFVQKILDEFVSSMKKKLDDEYKTNKRISVEDVKGIIDAHRDEAHDIFYIYDNNI